MTFLLYRKPNIHLITPLIQMDLMCYASEVHLLAVYGYYYLRTFPFLTIAWPGFPSVVSEEKEKIEISFIWKRLCRGCRINRKGPEGGTATKNWDSSQMQLLWCWYCSWFCGIRSFCHNRVRDKATGFPATWIALSFQALLDALMQRFTLNGSNHKIGS